MRYARIHSQAAENPEIGELLEDNPLAAALFFLSLTRCDLYGVLPAEPRRYRSVVAPAAILLPATVVTAIDAQEQRDLVRRYATSTGDELLQIVNYHKWQEVRWANGVGPPEHELPPWWEPPQEFVEWLVSDKCLLWAKHSERWWSIREHYCSTAVVQQLRDRCATLNKTQNTVNKKGKGLPSPSGRGAKPAAVALESEHQLACNACLTVWGLEHTDLDPEKKHSYYSAMGKIAEQQEDGANALLAWAQAEGEKTRVLRKGANPIAAIPKVLRADLSATVNQRSFAKARGAAGGNGRFILCPDGSKQLEKDWTPEDALWVSVRTSEGKWDNDRGMDREDERHPEFGGKVGI